MPLIGANGGLIGTLRSTNLKTASGLWTPNEQIIKKKSGQWPLASFGWSPSQLTPGLWLDADTSSSITLTSGAVSQWNDLSGNARHATQTIASKRPTVTSHALSGLNVVTFDASDDGMLTEYTVNRNYTIAIVALQSAASGPRLLNSTTQNRVLSIRRSNNNNVFLGGDVVSTPYGAADTLLIGVLVVSTSATSTYHYNGTNIAIASPTSADWGTLSLGAEGVYAEPGCGSIGELIVVPSALSTTDRQTLEGYLAYKWNLLSSLPAGHPYSIGV